MPPTRATEMPGAYAMAGRVLCNGVLLSLFTPGWEPRVSIVRAWYNGGQAGYNSQFAPGQRRSGLRPTETTAEH